MADKQAVVTYIRKGFQSWNIAIPSGEEFEPVRRACRGRLIRFTHDTRSGIANPTCSFITGDPHVIQFLTEWIERNPGVVQVDLRFMPMKCPYCDYQSPNGSDEGVEILSRHIAAEHVDILTGETSEKAKAEDADVEEAVEKAMAAIPDEVPLDGVEAKIDPDNYTRDMLDDMAVEMGADEKEVKKASNKQEVVDIIYSLGVTVPREDV